MTASVAQRLIETAIDAVLAELEMGEAINVVEWLAMNAAERVRQLDQEEPEPELIILGGES